MRRRWLVGLVALALLLAACGGDDEGGGAGGGGERQYSLTLIQGVKGDQFYVTMECGAQQAAAAAGATLEVTAPDEFDASLQSPIVRAVTAKKPDAILVAPTDTQAMIPPLTQAKAAGIKLVFVDTTTENGAELAESEIASDNEEGGREASGDGDGASVGMFLARAGAWAGSGGVVGEVVLQCANAGLEGVSSGGEEGVAGGFEAGDGADGDVAGEDAVEDGGGGEVEGGGIDGFGEG